MRRTSPRNSAPSPSFTLDDIAADLRAALAHVEPAGFAVADLEAALGWRRARVAEMMRRAFAAGMIECVGKQYRPAIDGSHRPVPIYRLRKRAA